MNLVFIELIQVFIGSVSGILAVAYFWVTIRAWRYGMGAYEINKSACLPSIGATISGSMKNGKIFGDKRSNHGLAIDLKSSELKAQQRLSSEAIDDVIGRRF